MKNKLTDLNNHLFAQLERLSDEELKGSELAEEIDRAKAITIVSSQIIQNGALALRAEQFKYDSGYSENNSSRLPDFLEG